MDAFITKKKRKSSSQAATAALADDDDNESTDVKLALLSSLHPDLGYDTLLDFLLAHEGSVAGASASLSTDVSSPVRRTGARSAIALAGAAQSSLRGFATAPPRSSSGDLPQAAKRSRPLSKKGRTLFLYDPVDVAKHTPCTVIHNFLPPEQANELLRELLAESATYEKITFKLFENVVSSPHTSSFYVGSLEELNQQRYEYLYNGAKLTDVRRITPQLEAVRPKVQEAVNREIQERIRSRYPGGRKLAHQSPHPFVPNAAFVNCYDGPRESVGYHSDQLTYLGPRAVIGSLSLGVAREFRVRRVVPSPDQDDGAGGGDVSDKLDRDDQRQQQGDAQGQISIHLPHNSLLVMHAEMQEEWKHSIAPAQAIEPHPVSGNRRINVTYRDYKADFHPKFTPRCKCGVPTVLRVVQKKKENWGRYFWMCHAGNVPGENGCTFFQWADFDDDGNPPWSRNQGQGLSAPPVPAANLARKYHSAKPPF